LAVFAALMELLEAMARSIDETARGTKTTVSTPAYAFSSSACRKS
jgi:hypothetical protein